MPGVGDFALHQLGSAEDGRQQVVEIVGDAGGHLAERAQLFRADELVLRGRQLAVGARALREEPHAAQGEGGEIGDVGEEALVGLREGPIGAPDADHAEDRVAGAQGHPHPVREPHDILHRLHASARTLPCIVVGADGASLIEDEPLQPPRRSLRTRFGERTEIGPVTPPCHDLELTTVRGEKHHDAGDREDPGHLREDHVEHRGAVELSGQGPRQRVQHGELLDLPSILLEEPRVLDGDARLAGDGLDERQLALAEIPGLAPPHRGKAPDHPLLGHDGDEEIAPVGEGRHERVDRAPLAQVTLDDRTLRAHRLGIQLIAGYRQAEGDGRHPDRPGVLDSPPRVPATGRPG